MTRLRSITRSELSAEQAELWGSIIESRGGGGLGLFKTNRRVDDATFAKGQALLGETGMIELATLVGHYCLISMVLNLFEVPLPGDVSLSWPG